MFHTWHRSYRDYGSEIHRLQAVDRRPLRTRIPAWVEATGRSSLSAFSCFVGDNISIRLMMHIASSTLVFDPTAVFVLLFFKSYAFSIVYSSAEQSWSFRGVTQSKQVRAIKKKNLSATFSMQGEDFELLQTTSKMEKTEQ